MSVPYTETSSHFPPMIGNYVEAARASRRSGAYRRHPAAVANRNMYYASMHKQAKDKMEMPTDHPSIQWVNRSLFWNFVDWKRLPHMDRTGRYNSSRKHVAKMYLPAIMFWQPDNIHKIRTQLGGHLDWLTEDEFYKQMKKVSEGYGYARNPAGIRFEDVRLRDYRPTLERMNEQALLRLRRHAPWARQRWADYRRRLINPGPHNYRRRPMVTHLRDASAYRTRARDWPDEAFQQHRHEAPHPTGRVAQNWDQLFNQEWKAIKRPYLGYVRHN